MPGDAPGAVTPKITRYTEAFRPQTDTTEIILHYSNFVHLDAGYLYAPKLGLADTISRVDQLRVFQVEPPHPRKERQPAGNRFGRRPTACSNQ